MIETIGQCHICKGWFDERVLLKLRISEHSGYERRLVCGRCLKQIEDASAAMNPELPQTGGSDSKPGLLMEDVT